MTVGGEFSRHAVVRMDMGSNNIHKWFRVFAIERSSSSSSTGGLHGCRVLLPVQKQSFLSPIGHSGPVAAPLLVPINFPVSRALSLSLSPFSSSSSFPAFHCPKPLRRTERSSPCYRWNNDGSCFELALPMTTAKTATMQSLLEQNGQDARMHACIQHVQVHDC